VLYYRKYSICSMPERYHYLPSQDAQDTRLAVEQHFQWTEPREPLPYAPSPDQVLAEEAATEAARASAQGFVLELIRAIAPPDEQPPLLLTAHEVRARYELHSAAASDDAGDVTPFTLREAWGAAERMRGHALELARATDDWSATSLARQLHRIADRIEDALPEHERPLPF
jgi:hypothetical protein